MLFYWKVGETLLDIHTWTGIQCAKQQTEASHLAQVSRSTSQNLTCSKILFYKLKYILLAVVHMVGDKYINGK